MIGETKICPQIYLILIHFTPTFLAFAQLTLFIFTFRFDTPRQLYEDQFEDLAMSELKKIYNTQERCIDEFKSLSKLMIIYKAQYPSYSLLFSKNHIGTLISASIMLCLRNSGEPFINLFDIINNNAVDWMYIMYPLFYIVGGIFSFFFASSNFFSKIGIGKRKMLIIGSISLILLYIPITTLQIMRNNEESYIIILLTLGVLRSLIFAGCISTLWFIYAIETVSERGFTLSMFFHWLSQLILDGMISHERIDPEFKPYAVIVGFSVCYFITSILVNIF